MALCERRALCHRANRHSSRCSAHTAATGIALWAALTLVGVVGLVGLLYLRWWCWRWLRGVTALMGAVATHGHHQRYGDL